MADRAPMTRALNRRDIEKNGIVPGNREEIVPAYHRKGCKRSRVSQKRYFGAGSVRIDFIGHRRVRRGRLGQDAGLF